MPSIPIRSLRADLAAAVRRAEAGEQLTITVAGRAAARLGPVGDSGSAPTVEELIARGALLPPRRVGAPRAPEPIPVWRTVRLDRVLAEIR